MKSPHIEDKPNLAYVIGVALGDGNLSKTHNRSVRLRITCDNKFPQLAKTIQASIKGIFPENKISVVHRKGCFDISCYSSHWEYLLGWKSDRGTKLEQKVKIPPWIKHNKEFMRLCLRGLFQTDGSIYLDRGYTMVNFVSYIPSLALDVKLLIESLGFTPNIQMRREGKHIKYTIRISKSSKKFINEIGLWKK